ncbi:unnamed protein product, partial [Ixodes pacificus]
PRAARNASLNPQLRDPRQVVRSSRAPLATRFQCRCRGGSLYETDGKDMQAVVPEWSAWHLWPGPMSGRTEGALRGQGALDGVVRSVPVREPAGRAWATPLPPRRGPPQRPSSRLGDPLSEATPAAAPAHADVHAGGTTGGRPADHGGTNHFNTRLLRAGVDTDI